MNPTTTFQKATVNILTLALSLFVLLIVPAVANAQSYTQEETNCYNLVQGKVAWDTLGHNSWSEPNARNLCKGTTNATGTVNCFKSRISSGLTWDKAITACSPTAIAATPPTTPPTVTTPLVSQPLPSKTPYNYSEERCVNMIQDHVMYDGNTFAKHWSDQNLANLCRGTLRPMKTVECFIGSMKKQGNWQVATAACNAATLFPGGLPGIDPNNPPELADVPIGITNAEISTLFNESEPFSEDEYRPILQWISGMVAANRLPFCWRQSDPRGVGTVPGRVADCPTGYTNNGATCGRNADSIAAASKVADCPSGYTNLGLFCFKGPDTYSAPSKLANCPAGYTNMGLDCQKGANIFDRSGDMTCPTGYFMGVAKRCYENCRDGYTNNGEFCGRGGDTLGNDSMTCPSGYIKSDITKRCIKKCPEGYTNTGETCFRGVSTLAMDSMLCKPGEQKVGARCFSNVANGCGAGNEWQNGLCYRTCTAGFYGEGPICWQNCPASHPKNCAAGCSTTDMACGMAVKDQALSTVFFVANVVSLGQAGLATGGANAAEKSTEAATKVDKVITFAKDFWAGIKPIRDAGSKAAKVYTVTSTTAKDVQEYQRLAASNFALITSREIEAEIDKHYGRVAAYFIKRKFALVHLSLMSKELQTQADFKDAFTLVGVIDPIGIVNLENAFYHPVCSNNRPFPSNIPAYDY